MSIPKYHDFYTPFLICIKDGKVHQMKEIVSFCATYYDLTANDLSETISSGQSVVNNRVGWASTYLKKAGLIQRVSKGSFTITEAGRYAIVEEQAYVDNDYLLRFESFREFYHHKSSASENTSDESASEEAASPQEQLDAAVEELRTVLADELMDEVMKVNPYDFERLVIDLLVAMGYGSTINAVNALTAKSGDEGIDGVLNADKFGFDSIYIQAKQWKRDSVVGRPEIQKFVGAMAGQGAGKGLFITTAKFSKEAMDYARKNLTSKVVLVDGTTLAKLMIDYNVGVSTVKSYEIKRIDTDYFADLS